MSALDSAYAASLPDTVSAVKPSILGVGTVQADRVPAVQLRGTAFVVGDGLHAITNAHVLERPLNAKGEEYLAVFVGSGSRPQVRRARRVAIDPEHDLAVLGFGGAPLPVLRLGNSDRVREGQSIAFMGFPIGAVLGLYPATARGIVSAITPIVTPAADARQLNAEAIRRLRTPYEVFQLDATAYPGNSGSPVFDPASGRVLAVVNMVFVKSTKEAVLAHPSGISYAIPGRYVRALLRRAGIPNR